MAGTDFAHTSGNDMNAANIQKEIGAEGAGLVQVNTVGGAKKTVNVNDLSEADAALAAQFGYTPVFKREFGYLSTFSFAVSISGLFSTVMTTFSYPLYAGGSASAVWCWLISGAGCMCIAVSTSREMSTTSNTWLTCPPSDVRC